MSTPVDRMSVTPSVARQTPNNEFGNVLKNALVTAANSGSGIAGAIVGSLPGGAIVSAAVSSVSALASQGASQSRSAMAATGVQTVGSGGVAGGGSVDVGGGAPVGGFNDMLRTMRQEADKSLLQQMEMQQESRQYNAVSNVLKVRHDSAKAAINNIR